MNDNLKQLKAGDLITFQSLILQGGQPIKKTIKGSIKNISGDNIFLDNNYFFDMETERRIMQPNIRIGSEIKPLNFIKKNRIIDYQKIDEEYNNKPTSKYEAIELLKEVIRKIIIENTFDKGTSTALYGGGNYNGVMPDYNQDKLNQDKMFPEESLRLIARKNLEDIKKQINMSQQSTDSIEKKAIEDFCFKHPSLIIYL